MTKNNRFIQALNSQPVDKIPFWYMRQAGRYLPEYRKLRNLAGSFLDLCYTPDFAVEASLQPYRRFHMDAVILFSDILVVPHALGQRLEFREGEGPVLSPVDDADKTSRLSLSDFHHRLTPIYQTISRLQNEISDNTALIGFAGAPWTVATYMVGGRGSSDQAATRIMAYQQKDLFQQLIDLLVQATSEYLISQIRNGADVIQIFDTWAGNLPDDQFRLWAIEPVRQIIVNIRTLYPDIAIISFPRGAGCRYPEYITSTGVTAVSVDGTMPPEWIRDNIQPLCPVQGNLDPLLLLAGGERLEIRVREILDYLSGGPFIFNLGHGILPQTPVSNVALVSEIIREYQRK